ncbi:MAG: hypothetical protein J6T28_03365 [Paludibacteraceae bacterium]|nr:hypothetical protein [Paludibacteraceae bacterium]MBP5480306.1 hypothetical protein [Paludibacteraceae bacterium]
MNCRYLVRGLFLISVFLTSSVASCLAEDSSYRKLLLEFIQKKEGTRSLLQKREKAVGAYSSLLVSMGCPEELARQRACKFHDEVHFPDRMNWMESKYKQSVTEQDLKNGITFFSSTAGSLAKEHLSVYHDEKVQAQMFNKITPDIEKIVAGEKAGSVSVSLPKSYQKAYREYYKLSSQEKSMGVLIGQIVSMISPDDEKLAASLAEYMNENMMLLLMEAGYPTVTEADLKAFSDFFKTESGKKFSKTNADILQDVMNFSTSETTKFQLSQKNWMEEEAAKTDSAAASKAAKP